ncbi:MAG: branched-chain-amino-acid transaminase [Candidatus Bathyarchaeota archaeon]|nr:branched-chain-amino-acid transaminase [Candidatus Bathyarchaeota archaeon]MDH5494466.1 branched-chain-amino-acid transaminase [Candidatus Bathyarchaeota archaeon]
MEKELLIYVDGKYYPKSEAKISVYDHGFLYGDGVFEGIRAYNGSVFKLKEHIDRLYSSARVIMLEIPITKEEMINAVIETLKKNNLTESYIRLVVSRGLGDLGLDPRKCPKPTIIIITDRIKLHQGGAKEEGLTAIISWVKRDAVDATSHEVKSLNYLNSILAKIEANSANVDEAICLNKQGFVCEGVAENIFAVSNGVIITPPTSTGALRGITRNVVIENAKKLGYTVVKKEITPSDLFLADEVFFTGTAAEVVPVKEINKRRIGDGKPGPITRRLMEEYQKLVRDPKEGVLIR